LCCVTPSGGEEPFSALSYSQVSDHRSMVFDARRNQDYFRALEKVITAETTVMDLGAGLGVQSRWQDWTIPN
jgi:hypothetical protein